MYTDGACSGNPGPGGWGAVLRYRFNGKVYEKELSGGDDSTTNNRMELTALIEALRQLKEPCEVRLLSLIHIYISGRMISTKSVSVSGLSSTAPSKLCSACML